MIKKKMVCVKGIFNGSGPSRTPALIEGKTYDVVILQHVKPYQNVYEVICEDGFEMRLPEEKEVFLDVDLYRELQLNKLGIK
jgi:hypothetical protein